MTLTTTAYLLAVGFGAGLAAGLVVAALLEYQHMRRAKRSAAMFSRLTRDVAATTIEFRAAINAVDAAIAERR